MLEVCILGPIEVHVHGTPCPVKSSTHRLLLAVLAAEHPRAVELRRLIDALWEVPPRTADKSLLSHVSRLRRRFGAEAIERVGDGYALRASVDADEFERLLDTDAADPAHLDRALGLWRGRPFGGLGDHPFLLATRERLESRHTEARLGRARLLLGDGQLAPAIALLDTIIADDPLHEGTWAALVDALRRGPSSRPRPRRWRSHAVHHPTTRRGRVEAGRHHTP
jgi:DNA-binding SARP family transcriptional activator